MGDREEVERIFAEYVFGFIFHDIEREIWLAKKTQHDNLHGDYPGPHPGGGNVLAALGLLSYTEFLGSFITGRRDGDAKNFNAFFARMPECYAEVDRLLAKDTNQKSVYNVFRSGMVHEYIVKRDCDIFMLRGQESCGIGAHDGRYYFVVERYYQDFREAAEKVYRELLAKPVLPA